MDRLLSDEEVWGTPSTDEAVMSDEEVWGTPPAAAPAADPRFPISADGPPRVIPKHDIGPTPTPDMPGAKVFTGTGTGKMADPKREAELNALPPFGQLEAGNIDLHTRPKVKNPDGSISTVRSMSVNIDGKEILIPTVSDDGRIMSDAEAIQQYRKTGKHLGKFDTPDNATAYAKRLHQEQEAEYLPEQDDGTLMGDLEASWHQLRQGLAGSKLAGAETQAGLANLLEQKSAEQGIPVHPGIPKMRAQAEQKQVEAVQDIVQSGQKSAAIPESPAATRFNRSKTFGEAWRNFWADPLTVTRSTTARSAAASVPSVVGGIIGSVYGPAGAAAGGGAGSYTAEFGSAIGDQLAEHGADLNNPESIKAVWKAHKNEITMAAHRRAVIVGGVDGLTAGITSKIALLPGGKTFLQKLASFTGKEVAGTTVEGIGGATGETLAEVAEGKPLDPAAIGGEMIGELGGGAVQQAGQIAVAAGKKAIEARPSNQPSTPEQINDFLKKAAGSSPEEIADFLDKANRAKKPGPDLSGDQSKPAAQQTTEDVPPAPSGRAEQQAPSPESDPTRQAMVKAGIPEEDIDSMSPGQLAQTLKDLEEQGSIPPGTKPPQQRAAARQTAQTPPPEEDRELTDEEAFGPQGPAAGTRSKPVKVKAEQDLETARPVVNAEPSEAQTKAGNYQKGHIKIAGFDVTIENPKGSIRRGKDEKGTAWESPQLPADYGYIKRTEGNDGDHLDVYIGPDPTSQNVYVIDQNDLKTGKFDEHKTVMGANSVDEAVDLYAGGFSDGKGVERIGHLTEMSMDEFKAWVKTGNMKKPHAKKWTRTKPEGQKVVQPEAQQNQGETGQVDESDDRMEEFDQALPKTESGEPDIIGAGSRIMQKVVGKVGFNWNDLTPKQKQQAIELAKQEKYIPKKPTAAAPKQPAKPKQEIVQRTPLRRNAMEDDTAITSAGREVPVQYAVVDAKDLVASQNDEGGTNPNYPAEMQPRDRERAVSAAQIQDIANKLNPRLLDKSPKASDGAPIVADDGVVESGNGRVLAIRRAYGNNLPGAERYRRHLEAQGYPVQDMEQPVLVRIRKGDMAEGERQAFTTEANARENLGMSPSEQAFADAGKVNDNMLQLYRGGDIDQAGNRDLVKAFMRDVVPANERADLVDRDGAIAPALLRRIEAALLAKAYGDAALVQKLTESTDVDIKAIGGALLDVAPAWAQMVAEAKAGSINPASDQTERLLEAVRAVERSRKEGQALSLLVDQQDMFSGTSMHPMAVAFLGMMYHDVVKWTRPMGRPKLANALRTYVEESRKTSAGTDLLGEAPADPRDIAALAKRKQDDGRADTDQKGFDFAKGPRADRGENLVEASQPGPEPADEQSQEGDGAQSDEEGEEARLEAARKARVAEHEDYKAKHQDRIETEFLKDPKRPLAVNWAEIHTLEVEPGSWASSDGYNLPLRGHGGLPSLKTARYPTKEAAQDAAARKILESLGNEEGKQADAIRKFAQRFTKGPNPSSKGPKASSSYGESNTFVNKDRAAEIRAKLKAKLDGTTLGAGIDPELLALGAELAAFHIEAGARKFTAFAKAIAADLGTTVKALRPYLRSWYNGARDMMEDGGLDVADMDSAEQVKAAIKEIDDAPSSSPSLEPDRGKPESSDRVGEEDVSDEAAGDGRSTRSGGKEAGEAERPAGGRSLPQDYAPVVGEDGHLELPFRESEPAAGDTADRGFERGADDSAERLPAERGATDDTIKNAEKSADLKQRREAQRKAESTTVKTANAANVAETLPMLFPEQQDDVYRAELRYEKPNGHGMLFTNGTGTGKTYSGLGVAKRFHKQGKKNILIVAPSQGIITDWIKSGRDTQLDIAALESTTDAGKGVVATTFANLGQNRNLVDRQWDLVIADEAHKLSSDKDGTTTAALEMFRALTFHPEGLHARARHVLRHLYDKIATFKSGSAEAKAAYDAWWEKAKPLIEVWRGQERPKALMMSATPFAYHFSLDYAEGYLFEFDRSNDTKGGYNSGGGREQFYMQHLGYRMRYNKLTKPDASVQSEIMERELHEKLKREGSLWGRALEVEKDYDRKFVLVHDAIGGRIDEALKFLWEADDGKFGAIAEMVNDKFDYLTRRRLLEAIKARAAIPYIKKSLALGRKVVVFHDYNEGGGISPFELGIDADSSTNVYKDGKYEKVMLKPLYDEFLARNPYVKDLKFSSYGAPIATLTKAFPDAMLYNGTVPNKQRNKNKADFNTDGNGKDIIIVQSAAGEAGISLHDITNAHQRVLLNLGMPNRPTTALQQEGRVYRVGQASDALFRYMNTGTNWERWTFAGSIAERSGTAENLALGNQARTIRLAFIDAFQNADEYEPTAGEGKGGKAIDRATSQSISEFDRAKTHYFAQQKNTKKRDQREGVDYFATAEPLGYKMVQWADLKQGEKILEPSAGHGAIARYFPEDSERTLVEPSSELASRAALNSPGARVVVSTFESFNLVNKYDAIVMNPPFGSGGKTAIEHVAKAAKHLKNGGRIVALIPRGPSADKRFDDFMASDEAKGIYQVGVVLLPSVAFERAGTSVQTRVVILEKHTDAEVAARLQEKARDYTSAEKISEFFDRIEETDMGRRLEPVTKEVEAAADGTVKAGDAQMKLYESDRHAYAAIMKMVSADLYGRLVREARKQDGKYVANSRAFEFADKEKRQAFLDAMNRPEEAPKAMDPGTTFNIAETIHAKKGTKLFVATPKERVADDIFSEMSATAKRFNGYYSYFRGSGAIPGFQFTSEADRLAFIKAMTPDDAAPKAQMKAPGFYSALVNAIEAMKQPKAPAGQWMAMIRNAPGIKQDEIQWIGLEGWLGQQSGPITKEALLDFVRANQVDVREVVKGGEGYEGPVREYQSYLRAEGLPQMSADELLAEGNLTPAQQRVVQGYIEAFENAADPSVKFASYQLPGGENYRELLLTLPEKAGEQKYSGYFVPIDEAAADDVLHGVDDLGLTDYDYGRTTDSRGNEIVEFNDFPRVQWEQIRNLVEAVGGTLRQIEPGPQGWNDTGSARSSAGDVNFRSGHWTEPNILAHVRFNERTQVTPGFVVRNKRSSHVSESFDTKAEAEAFRDRMPEFVRDSTEIKPVKAGKTSRTLFIEEIQSDWHQKGRKQGYSPTEDKITWEWNNVTGWWAGTGTGNNGAIITKVQPGSPTARTFTGSENKWKLIKLGDNEHTVGEFFDTPDDAKAAFQKSTLTGVPDAPFKTSWPELALKRMIRWAAENGFDRVAWTPGDVQAARYDLSKQIKQIIVDREGDKHYRVRVYDLKDNKVMNKPVSSPEELADAIGKDAAEKALKQMESGSSRADLRDLDLVMGGEGMKGFYDKILVDAANKLGKKFGVKVGKVTLRKGEISSDYAREMSHYSREAWDRLDAATRQRYTDEVYGRDGLPTITAHSLEITDAMRDSVMAGQPLFKRDKYKAPPRVKPRAYTDEELASFHGPFQRIASALLGHRVLLDVVNVIPGKPDNQAQFHPVSQLIEVAMAVSTHPTQTFGHELFHLMRQRGLITKPEWAAIRRWAIKQREQMKAKESYAEFYRENTDASEPEVVDGVAEEVAADALGDIIAGRTLRDPDGLITRILTKVKNFLEALRNWLNKAGFLTTEEILESYAQGALRNRAPNPENAARIMRRQRREPVAQQSEKFSEEPGAEDMPQMVIPGAEKVSQGKQAQRLADAALKPRVAQKGMDIGLFGDEKDQPSLFDDYVAKASMKMPPSRNAGQSFIEPVDQWRDIMASNAPYLARISKGSFYSTRRALEDKMADMARIEAAIEDQTGPIDAAMRVYQTETLYAGRAGERLEDLRMDELEPLAKDMHERGVTREDIDEYLYARHAPERNAYIATINPRFPDGGSGMTDAEAAQIMASFGPRLADLQAIAARIDRIRNATLTRLLNKGVIDQPTHDSWKTFYKHYVPLRGFEADPDEDAFVGSGKGKDTRTKVSQEALGRKSKADSPLAYLIAQAQQAIILGEKARVGRALLRLARTYPNGNLWEVDQKVVKQYRDKATGLVSTRIDNTAKMRASNVLAVREGGNLYWITLHHDGLAKAFRGSDADSMHAVLRLAFTLQRLYAMTRTSYDPQFFIPNFLRDVQTAGIHISAEQGKAILGRTIKNLPVAMRGVWHGERGKLNSQWAKTYREFALAGGKIGVFGLNDIEAIKGRISRDIRLLKGGPLATTEKTAIAVFNFMDNLNAAVENAVRLSLYEAMRNAGYSQDDAAYAAKEVTVNFNRSGNWSKYVNIAFVFFKAGVNGTSRVVKLLNHPGKIGRYARRAAYGLFLAGLAMDILNGLFAGDDDDDGLNDYDQIPEWIRERNYIIMLPGQKGEYLKIPMPWLYNVFQYAGVNTGRVIRGKVKAGEASLNVGLALLQAMNPLQSFTFAQTVTPSLLDPAIELYANKDWKGDPIMPDDRPGQTPKPDSQKYWQSVNPYIRETTDFLNSATGGDEIRPGGIDVSPESVSYIGEFLGGGVAATLNQISSTLGKVWRNEELDWDKVPFVRKVYGTLSSTEQRNSYYAMRTAIDMTHDQIEAVKKDKSLTRAERAAKVRELEKEYAVDVRAKEFFDKTDKKLKERRKTRNKAGYGSEKAGDAQESMDVLMARARKRYRLLQEKYP